VTPLRAKVLFSYTVCYGPQKDNVVTERQEGWLIEWASWGWGGPVLWGPIKLRQGSRWWSCWPSRVGLGGSSGGRATWGLYTKFKPSG